MTHWEGYLIIGVISIFTIIILINCLYNKFCDSYEDAPPGNFDLHSID